MFDQLTALGYGITVFAIVLGVGTVVLWNFGLTQAECATDYHLNTSSGYCTNASGGDATTPTGTSYTNVAYLQTQMGTTGLAGWTPAIIAISVGILFLGAFMIKGGRKGRY